MKKVYGDALKYRYTDSLLKISEAQLAELKTTVSLLTEKDQETKNNYERQIANLESQIAVFKDQVSVLEKSVKREKRKRFWTSVGGTLTTIAGLFLFFTK